VGSETQCVQYILKNAVNILMA